MATLNDLCGINFKLQKVTQGGNIFTGNGKVCLLKAVNREYTGVIKKPLYYLNLLLNGKSEYLTGLFATKDAAVFSGDYRDALGIKHIVKVSFQDAGKAMLVKAAA
jgi:hypothetical protein